MLEDLMMGMGIEIEGYQKERGEYKGLIENIINLKVKEVEDDFLTTA